MGAAWLAAILIVAGEKWHP
ncbi:hypothetical protein [Mixta mediterraneensis]